jgi:hypothetical protein
VAERTAELEDLLNKRAGRQAQVQGVAKLAALILARLQEHILTRPLTDDSGNTVVTPTTLPGREQWVQYNFARPLLDLFEKAKQNARIYLIVNLLIIGGGFATSGIAIASKGSKVPSRPGSCSPSGSSSRLPAASPSNSDSASAPAKAAPSVSPSSTRAGTMR